MNGGNRKLSDEMRSAFVDGELEARDEAEILAALGADPVLRDQVAGTRVIKDMVRSAYDHRAWYHRKEAPGRRTVPGHEHRAASRLGPVSRAFGLALLLIGSGWAGSKIEAWRAGAQAPVVARTGSAVLPGMVSAVPGQVASLAGAERAAAERVLVHLSSGHADDQAEALRGVESLLAGARSEGRPLLVELVVNSAGIDLVRADVTPFASRLAELQRRYPELAIVACSQTLARLRERGVRVDLVPGVSRASSALDQVVRRLHEGWLYVRT